MHPRFHLAWQKIGLTVLGFAMLLSLLSLQGCLFNARSKVSIPYQAVAITGPASATLLGLGVGINFPILGTRSKLPGL